MYYSLIYPFLINALPVYGTADRIHLNNRVVRWVTFSEPISHSLPLFKELDILTIFELFKVETSKLQGLLFNNSRWFKCMIFCQKKCMMHYLSCRGGWTGGMQTFGTSEKFLPGLFFVQLFMQVFDVINLNIILVKVQISDVINSAQFLLYNNPYFGEKDNMCQMVS